MTDDIESWATKQVLRIAENMFDCKLCSDVFFYHADAVKHVLKVHAKDEAKRRVKKNG